VSWFEVDRLGDALLERCGTEAAKFGEEGGCTGWVWYPPAAGITPMVEYLDEMDPDTAERVVETEHADRMAAVVDSVEKAYKSARKCLPAPARTVIRRRIRYLKKLQREPWRIPTAMVCGPDKESGYRVCGFPAIEAEARRIAEACELSYHPTWPKVAAMTEAEREELGLPPMERDEDEEPDQGGAVTMEEREAEPWAENPRKKKRKRKTKANPGAKWGELVDLEAKVIELEIRRANGVIEAHTWHTSQPRLYWSEKRQALVFVQGGKAPSGRIEGAPSGPAARRFKAWRGKKATATSELKLPAAALRPVGVAVRIVYSSKKYRDGVARHHDFGAGVRVYATKGRLPRLWQVSGGKLTATSRGLVN
jgi:hypothetical protein